MGKATLARQRAIGAIGVARVQRLDEAGLVAIDQAEYERLKTELAEAKRQIKLLQLTPDERKDVAAQVLAAGMRK
jgi:hypothetical protein